MNQGHLEIALNLVWVLMAGFLVMFMQVGFAMVETGFTRAKNAVNTMAMNILVYPIGVLGFWLVGYGLMSGGVAGWPSLGEPLRGAHEVGISLGGHHLGLFGAARFALLTAPHDPANLAMFLFAAVFMDTAATIPTGAMAERWRFASFLVYGLFMSMLLYPLYGNWVWGGGWLATMGTNWGLGHGHVDFAGSSVVHMTGGLTALAGAIVLGPRAGKFRRDGTVGAIPGHNLPMTIIGTLILAFGGSGSTPVRRWRGPIRASPPSPSTPCSPPARAPSRLWCSSGTASASPTSPWPAMASSAVWWRSPLPAPSSARRPPS